MDQRVISLGGNCMATMEMRRFFGVDTANLFDWWITPGDALVLLVENDFYGLFSRENLKVVGDRQSVANLRYGILHHHDFPRNDAENRIVGTLDEHLPHNLEKFAYLKQRWDDLASNPYPVLFIRYQWHIGEALLHGIPAEPVGADPARLIAALDRKFPKLDYQILFIDAPAVTVQDPRILHRNTANFTEPGERLDAANLMWKDNTAIFTRLFSTVALREAVPVSSR